MKVLGAPLGQPAYVQAHLEARAEEEQSFLDLIPDMPDLQSAWVLLLYCAAPRANHLLRMLPPSQSEGYARQHDTAVRGCLSTLLQQRQALGRQGRPWRLASLPLRLGGAGLRSSERTAPGAYWAAWADALPVLRERQPGWAQRICTELQKGLDAGADCLQQAEAAGNLLENEGWAERPSWPALLAGARPTAGRAAAVENTVDGGEELSGVGESAEPGEWKHGWQYSACSIRETRFREHTLLPVLPPDCQAILRSNSGPGAGCWLTALPTTAETRLQPSLFQVALRRRLRLRLLLTNRRCPGRSCRCLATPSGTIWQRAREVASSREEPLHSNASGAKY